MELVNVLTRIPVPILVAIIALWAILTVVMVYQYVKMKKLDGIRKDVYKLFEIAEHKYEESDQGKQKLKYVVSEARKLLPKWLQLFLTEEALMKIIDAWFKTVKDFLDDGKVNGSQK